jgi:hypothetical protein
MTQEIINFENGKYTWQDIPGKGRSLVPYIEPPKPKITIDMIVPGASFNWSCREPLIVVGPLRSNPTEKVFMLGNHYGKVYNIWDNSKSYTKEEMVKTLLELDCTPII